VRRRYCAALGVSVGGRVSELITPEFSTVTDPDTDDTSASGAELERKLAARTEGRRSRGSDGTSAARAGPVSSTRSTTASPDIARDGGFAQGIPAPNLEQPRSSVQHLSKDLLGFDPAKAGIGSHEGDPACQRRADHSRKHKLPTPRIDSWRRVRDSINAMPRWAAMVGS
jgi:hypothetical protein